jgi:Cobalamin biosynthesis protein CobT (nicotinate-mononucleotide:5, 6-dimethylbenzimidazole phosphoribosyltransferase)
MTSAVTPMISLKKRTNRNVLRNYQDTSKESNEELENNDIHHSNDAQDDEENDTNIESDSEKVIGSDSTVEEENDSDGSVEEENSSSSGNEEENDDIKEEESDEEESNSNEDNSVLESYDGDSEGDEPESKHGLEAMGDVISKILNKKVDSTSNIVLSKSKNTHKRNAQLKEEIKSKKAKTELLYKQREKNHVLPIEKNDAPKEARLRRIGTKGVVMLFNAVSAHQKSKAEKMKTAKTEGHKAKVEKSMKKSTFMDMLKTDKKKSPKLIKKKSLNDDHDLSEENEEPAKTNWNVLKSDFMLGSSLKHWDRDENDDNPSKNKKTVVKESLDVESSDEEEKENT